MNINKMAREMGKSARTTIIEVARGVQKEYNIPESQFQEMIKVNPIHVMRFR